MNKSHVISCKKNSGHSEQDQLVRGTAGEGVKRSRERHLKVVDDGDTRRSRAVENGASAHSIGKEVLQKHMLGHSSWTLILTNFNGWKRAEQTNHIQVGRK